jgi:hypothetical protein
MHEQGYRQRGPAQQLGTQATIMSVTADRPDIGEGRKKMVAVSIIRRWKSFG